MISTPTLFVSGALLIVFGILLGAYIKARRQVADLCSKLEAAQLRQERDRRELTERSQLDDLKDEFVSTVSHELRTPLTSIRGALGLLSSGVLGTVDAQAQNLLRIALTNTERLIRLINDILDLQRMDSGRSVIQVRRCSLPELIHQAIETMTAMADASEVKLVVAPAAKALLPSIFFDGDSDRILQVLTNLLSNAIKFSPPASAVTIEVETPPDTLIFRIVDQGRGIPEDQLETIFERFRQVEDSDSRQRGGTGLGLAICRSIILQHGGSVWAQRNPIKGASVCVKLPRSQRTYDAAMQEQATIGAATDLQPNGKADRTILICDDNEAHRFQTTLQLRTHGHTVYEASSGEEAIKMAELCPTHSPLQAILLDLHMADAGAWQLLKLLTSNASTCTVPIIVMSVLGAAGNRESLAFENDDRLCVELGRVVASGKRPAQVLIVEDDEVLASAILAGFAQADVTAHSVSTLDGAMACCREVRPDLLVLNLSLSNGDGFALVEWLCVRPDLRSLPMIVYSGRDISQEERLALHLGSGQFFATARVQVEDVEQLVLTMVYKGHVQTDFRYRPGDPAASPGARTIHL